ncbi:MAG: TerB N-terminal domain-containing protein [Acidimicrobiales bacterium]|nr:TerB N-terminal domain-containing protein [Acidimicrobiales bacterium]
MKPPKGRGTITWIPAGQTVSIGESIPGGLLYVGSGALAENGYSVEPALIDPKLPVQWKRADHAASSLDYWPAYEDLTAGQRAGYLRWLIDGRSRPDAPIGFVFLYFYGLERRFLVDLGSSADHPEARLIADEVRRLLGVYGENRSFESYATGLLGLIDAVAAHTAQLAAPDWTSTTYQWEVPPVVRVGLGRYAAANQPIPARWALTLLRLHPESYLRTPATRCQSEFDELFRQRYRDRFGDGMVVQPPKARVTVEYRAASSGLRGDYGVRLDDVPDICAISGPINKLKDLAADCTDALDAYSRFLGRNPDGAGDSAAIGLLPDELMETHGGPVLDNFRTWAEAVADAQAVPLDDIVERWSPGREKKLTKKDAVALAGFLGKVGIGIEPDVRFGGRTPTPGSTAVVFPLPEPAPAAPSPAYSAASVLVHLTAVLAASDGSVSADERQHLAEHLEASLGLDTAECVRLDAHLAWLTADKPSLAGVKRRLESLDERRRSAIAHFLVDVAAADGVVSPDEITTLTKLYKLLGLDENDVYRVVHALGSDTGPVTVRQADDGAPRHAIPEPSTAPQPLALDPDKVQARLAETATVAALLADIFTEDDEPTPTTEVAAPSPSSGSSDAATVDGLDAAHSTLADQLRGQATWPRTAAEDLATTLGLPLLAGALDRINEAAMDACGEPLVEGDDPLELNDYAAQEMFG